MLEILNGLNRQQKDSILESLIDDSLVLAGAGSGKTKVLITRIQYILTVLNKKPSSIMAITFTNKAADELLERAKKVTEDSNDMWVGTYHSICIRFLKMFGEDIGLDNFTILDQYNARKSAEGVLLKLDAIISKSIVRGYLTRIGNLKNELISPEIYADKKLKKYKGDEELFKDDPEYEFIEFYKMYQEEHFKNQTLDFDDIIYYTIILLNTSESAKRFIKKTFSFIHADEVQDSNTSNIILLKMLSQNCNLFLVGDLDQSIYGFRGARPEYILNIDKVLPESKLFKLEQNYRSTKTIVNSSNTLISNNDSRLDKVCFSENIIGDPITISSFKTNKEESDFICSEIKGYISHGKQYNDIMVLYRTNNQSRVIEKTFIEENIPYVIIGSTSFNERAEIKDCLSFLRVSVNKRDRYSFKRALSTLDDIGSGTIDNILAMFDVKLDALETLKSYKTNRKTAQKSIDFFIEMLNLIDEKPTGVLNKIAEYYIDKLKSEGTAKSIERIENIEELLKVAKDKEDKGVMLKDFVNQMDLLSKADKESKGNAVSIMTIHSSKGLESDIVFMIGTNDGILPHDNSLSNIEDLEEERRLCYVGMTRAKKKLYILSYALDGQKVYEQSRFIKEIPDMYIENI